MFRTLILLSSLLLPTFVSSNPVKVSSNAVAKEKFKFLINADPQMGDQFTDKPGLKVLNELLSMFVAETNLREGEEKPDFVVWAGDLVWDPFQNAFDNFERIVSKMNVPSVLVHGNHDGYNDDPKFLNVQESLSGYRKLNYSFDYGQWHFVVISAQEKYLDEDKKKEMLAWLDNELKTNKDKKTMLFMHYHILPTGLSQTEFYTYFPIDFKNKMLETIVRYGNVKYTFSGHVHIGVKASVKTARKYKGTNFILAPTPVFPRPFGEEYPKFREKNLRYRNKGFYMEVHVDGDKVDLVGRKIGNSHKAKYPKKFKEFNQNEDIRAFIPESKLPANDELINGDFSDGNKGWQSSYRYQRDHRSVFSNYIENGKSILNFVASFGSWTFDEYMENYQLVKYKPNYKLETQFSILPSKHKGGGGYIRLFAYDVNDNLSKVILLHWGTEEAKVRFMQQSWAYNALGDRHNPLWLDKLVAQGDMLSYPLEITPLENQKLSIDVDTILNKLAKPDDAKIDHLTLAYGVWGRINQRGKKFSSNLMMDSMNLFKNSNSEIKEAVVLNNKAINKTEKNLDYGSFFNKKKKK